MRKHYSNKAMNKRFRGFLPVVVDVETGGLNPQEDALLEIAAMTLKLNDDYQIVPDKTYHEHILPFAGTNLDPEALAITGIDPYQPLRFAVEEKFALENLFNAIEVDCQQAGCQRAVLVGHNPFFDLSFIQAASRRQHIEKQPFHAFTTFDTASLSAVALGQTVLARACIAAGIPFDTNQAHSALYDTERTAELFCYIVNRWSK